MTNRTLFKLYLIFLLLVVYSCNKRTDFNKIIYNYYGGFGGPVYNLELKNDKTFVLKRNLVLIDGTSSFDFQYDSTKIGYFGGNIDNKHFDQIKFGLTKILDKDSMIPNLLRTFLTPI